jgi:restriction system protein
MPIPDYQSLMLPVLTMSAQGGERRVGDIVETIADRFGLTAEERTEMLPSGRQRVLHNRIHWAKFYLTKAGLINSPSRGRFIVSDEGRRFLANSPSQISLKDLLKIEKFKEFYLNGSTLTEQVSETDSAKSEAISTPEERIEAASQEIKNTLRRDLLERIGMNSPAFFEQLIVDLLVAMGYGGTHKNAAKQLGRSGDGGVDGVINEDRLGLDRVYIQAKRYTEGSAIGRPDVQGFVGSLVGLGATKGVFVTTSTFSSGAREFVKHLSQRVILIDGHTLAELMIEHGVGVRTSQTILLSRLDEDFFAEEP